MAYTTINKSLEHFNTKLYTGNGGTQTISGVGFQPDFTWVKGRNYGYYHYLQDVVRGSQKILYSNNNESEATITAGISAWNADGYVTGSQGALNYNGRTFVAWNWKANGAGSSNTDGSITSTVSANTTAGFSIVSYTGTGSNATVGHGLSSAPEFITIKNRNDASSWLTYLTTIGAGNFLRLNENYASASGSTPFNNTASTSSVFSVGANNDTNGSSDSMIAYCFSSVRGYSKIGSYTGNGSSDGPFVYTGFKPAFVMVKETNNTKNWAMFDNKRTNTFNPVDGTLYPDSTDSEGTDVNAMDFVSNGFKHTSSNAGNYSNDSGDTYIYMAFAEAPLVGSNGVTAKAK